MRLWRSRRVPGFEGQWACSPECMAALVEAAVEREMKLGGIAAGEHMHRIPLGLLLVEQGCLSSGDLRKALEDQRGAAGATGTQLRLGEWLLRNRVLTEQELTRALSAQWNCPVLSLEGWDARRVTALVPHLFAEGLEALPVRSAGSRLLYLAFGGAIDRSLSYAVERMTGMQVVAGIARDSEFRGARARFLRADAPRTRFLEAASPAVLARALTRLIEGERAAEARLARVHDVWWLRLWKRDARRPQRPAWGEVEDLLCRIRARQEDFREDPSSGKRGSLQRLNPGTGPRERPSRAMRCAADKGIERDGARCPRSRY